MIVWLSVVEGTPARGYWDQAFLEDILKDLPETERTIVVIPGANQPVDEINKRLSEYKSVLVVITSDEGNKFPVRQLSHPDMIVYKTYPVAKDEGLRLLPIGYTPQTKLLKKYPATMGKFDRWFFSGQVNHPSRRRMVEVLKKRKDGKLNTTSGFSKGMEHTLYFDALKKAKVVPAPGGPQSPDSFRLYEALEAGAVPIAENKEFIRLLHGEVPFPVLDDWSGLDEAIDRTYSYYPSTNNMAFAWWQRRKIEIARMFRRDLKVEEYPITVLIPTSPIPSHPDTGIIETTLQSVRERLPEAQIILMIDGVREEQRDRQDDYEEYTRRLLWITNQMGVYPLLFEDHKHQAVMTREALKYVLSPCILFVEHDTPLIGDVDWEGLQHVVITGHADVVRLHHEAEILKVHRELMIDDGPIEIEGVPLIRTYQWSQRPHLASTEFYEEILKTYFGQESRTMIEDVMHGVVDYVWREHGIGGWMDYRVCIYAPEGNMQRSSHLDGRGKDPKFDMIYEYDTETPVGAPRPTSER